MKHTSIFKKISAVTALTIILSLALTSCSLGIGDKRSKDDQSQSLDSDMLDDFRNDTENELATHTHVYDKEIATDTYKKSAANCTARAVYYKSCSCGAAGTDTFEYGGMYHNFDRRVASSKYFYASATETAGTLYYYSCVCGLAGTETFDNGDVLPTAGLQFTKIADGYEVSGYEGTATNVIIPSTYNGEYVISIGFRAFAYKTNIESIIMPDSITTIGDYAFIECHSIRSISMSKGLTSIGTKAFYLCRNLQSISIPLGVNFIGKNAFQSCTQLTIYAAASSEPIGWESTWNSSNKPVNWNSGR